MTTALLTVAGQVAGNAIGGPLGALAGSFIGAALGNAIAGPQEVQGPRLDDLRATALEYGATIPLVYGHPRVPGAIVWSSPKLEIATTQEQGGKGGPSVETTTYTYKQSVLYMVSANQIGGVRRIWANGELVWNVADTATGSDIAASGGILSVSPLTTGATNYWDRLTVYTGDDDQLPDATYETAVGVGNAPAYRGHGTIFIEGLNLGGSGYAPQFTFELCPAGGDQEFSIAWSVTGPSGATPGAVTPALGTDTLFFNNTGGWSGSSFTTSSDAVDVQLISLNYGSDPNVGNQGTVIFGAADAPSLMTVSTSVNSGGDDYSRLIGYLDGAQRAYTFTPNQGINQKYYCIKGGHTYFANALTDDKKVFRFSRTGGNQIAESSVFSDYCSGLAANSDHVFYVGGTTVYQLDAISLALLDSFPVIGDYHIFCGDDEELYALTTLGVLYRRDLSSDQWVSVRTISGVTLPLPANVQHSPVYSGGVISLLRYEISGGQGLSDLYSSAPIFSADPEPLGDVVRDLCDRAGLESAYVNISDLSGDEVESMAITQVTPARQVIETLMSAYHFSAVESDSLRFVKRGAAAVAAPSFDELGASESGSTDRLPITRASDVEISAQVSVTYSNVMADQQNGTEYSDRLVGEATGVTAVQIPIGMTPTQAKRIADVNILDAVVAKTSIGPIGLSTAYAALEPTDVITLTDETGSTFRCWIDSINDANGFRTLNVRLDDASVINSEALTVDTDQSSSVVRATEDTLLELLDIPILRDADNDAGHYAAVSPESTDGLWPGAALFRGVNDAGYSQQATFTDRTFIGTTGSNILGDFDGVAFDEENSIIVSGTSTLQSYTEDQILLGTADAYLIGDEVLYAKRATLLAPGTYVLAGLLRGRRGTDWAIPLHEADERVVLLRAQGIRRIQMENTQLGVNFSYKAPTLGRPLASADEELFTNTGIGLKPFSPGHVEGERDTSSNLTITWQRRTRLACRWGGSLGTNVPLGESSEAYEVDVIDSGTVVRTISASDESASYSAVQQTTDGFTPGDPITVIVYQISSIVGRGYGAEATL